MHFCFFNGKGEEWSHDLAMSLIGKLEKYLETPVESNDSDTINETSEYLLSRYIKEHKYVVLVVSQKLFADIYSLVELDIIEKLYRKGEIVLFSIYDGKHIPVLPERAEWINETWKIPINKLSDIDVASTIILERVLKDRLVDNIASNMAENIKDNIL